MLHDNLVLLRKMKGYSQEEVAERIGISRQAYGKWESGETIPDIARCALLAKEYGVSLDSLVKEHQVEDLPLAPAPVGKHLFGTVAISERGQIVIPKEARELFGLEPGCKLVVLGDEGEGIALLKAEQFEQSMREVLSKIGR